MNLLTLTTGVKDLFNPFTGQPIILDFKIQKGVGLALWESDHIEDPLLNHPKLIEWWQEKKEEILQSKYPFETLYERLELISWACPQKLLEKSSEMWEKNKENFRKDTDPEEFALEEQIFQNVPKTPGSKTAFPDGIKELENANLIRFGTEEKERILITIW